VVSHAVKGGGVMAIAWLTILKSVPWSEVISNAPRVADAAKKLWNAVANKSVSSEPPPPGARSVLSPEAKDIAALETRLVAVEVAFSDLHSQMLASSELIKALADQNAQLINCIEANRIRVLWLTTAMAAVAIVTLVGLALVLTSL
jgi:hypothetical protein